MIKRFAHLDGPFSSQALVYIGAAALNALVPFLLLPFLARWLGPADFGIAATFAAIVSVLGTVIGLNVHGLVSVAFFRDGEQAMARQIAATLAIVAGMGTAAFLLIGLFADDLTRMTGISARWLPAIVAAAVGQFVIATGLTTAQTVRRPWIYGSIQLGYGCAFALLTVVLVGIGGWGWQGRILAQALAAFALAATAVAWMALGRRIAWQDLGASCRKAFSFGVPLMPHAIAAVVMASSDRFILSAHAGAASVGEYFLAFQLASLLLILATAINQAWLPWLYARLARDDEEARRQIRRALLAVLIVLAGAAAIMALLAPFLIPLAGGERYADAMRPLQLLAPGLAGQAFYMFVSGFLFYEHRTGLLSAISVTVACVQIALLLALVRFGPAGVAAAQGLTGIIYAAATAVAARLTCLAARRRKATASPTPSPGQAAS